MHVARPLAPLVFASLACCAHSSVHSSPTLSLAEPVGTVGIGQFDYAEPEGFRSAAELPAERRGYATLAGGQQVEIQFEPELAAAGVPVPVPWRKQLAGWKDFARVIGESEVCFLGGRVGEDFVRGGLCFDAGSRRWRALGGDVVPYSLGPGGPDYWTCKQERFGSGTAWFVCTVPPPPPGSVDRCSGRPLTPTPPRWEAVTGVR